MIKLTDAAKLLKVHLRTVFKWVRDKKITFFGLDPDWNICVPLEQIKRLKAAMASPEARGEAIVTEVRVRVSKDRHSRLGKTLEYLKFIYLL